MKCKNCGKEYTHEEVRRKCGTTHPAEYGCCSQECYDRYMANMMQNPYSN
ncbi:MAG: hypothetical protein ACOC5T_05865 [Elusimicrobiota bacterium]